MKTEVSDEWKMVIILLLHKVKDSKDEYVIILEK